jgi:hypothetical protein
MVDDVIHVEFSTGTCIHFIFEDRSKILYSVLYTYIKIIAIPAYRQQESHLFILDQRQEFPKCVGSVYVKMYMAILHH